MSLEIVDDSVGAVETDRAAKITRTQIKNEIFKATLNRFFEIETVLHVDLPQNFHTKLARERLREALSAFMRAALSDFWPGCETCRPRTEAE